MAISKAIDNLLNSSSFQSQLKSIQMMAVSELQQAVQTYVYDAYPNPKYYERTYELLNAVTCDVIITPNNIEFKVYFDSEKMNHTTYGGSEKYSLDAGDYVDSLLPMWLNEGWRWDGYQGDFDMFRARPGGHFFEKAVEKIRENLIVRINGAIKVELVKSGFSK
jgi:hypothetical protein